MILKIRWWIWLGCCLLGLPTVQATHIVGGEITYKWLADSTYEISLTIFRDCDTGVPWFDDPASVGIFGSNNQFIRQLVLPWTGVNDTLEPVLSDPCLTVPPNVCIHRTTYTTTTTLPYRAGGYQLSYQRCCRNQDIVNIVNPLATGATYYTVIPEAALLGQNSSALFNAWPPVYICADVPIHFDHSATDIDGDSIVYEMCTPLEGASEADPMPQPPNPPPYTPVLWQSGYALNNMLGNTADRLKIDPVTGLLTGTPDDLGVFVVGVCAKEYRNGQLISITRRDFQYAIGMCGRTSQAMFSVPEEPCNQNLQVNFNNQSVSARNEYYWNFDTTDMSAISSFKFPSYIYPDTGLFVAMLIVDPGSPCADTVYQEVHIERRGIEIATIPVELVCRFDTAVLRSVLLSNGGDSLVYQWSPGAGVIGSSTADSLVVWADGDRQYKLVVENEHGCKDSILTAVNVSQMTPPLDITAQPDSVYEGQHADLLATQDNGYVYSWQADATLSDTTIYNPQANPVVNPSMYYLTVTDNNGCFNTDSITIYILPPVCGNPLIFVPNTFTPNGDGVNDVLYVRGANLLEVYLTIYNRWGERVFETSDQSVGWDGRHAGRELPPDVYGYYLRCRCEEGQEYFEKRNITLIR